MGSCGFISPRAQRGTCRCCGTRLPSSMDAVRSCRISRLAHTSTCAFAPLDGQQRAAISIRNTASALCCKLGMLILSALEPQLAYLRLLLLLGFASICVSELPVWPVCFCTHSCSCLDPSCCCSTTMGRGALPARAARGCPVVSVLALGSARQRRMCVHIWHMPGLPASTPGSARA